MKVSPYVFMLRPGQLTKISQQNFCLVLIAWKHVGIDRTMDFCVRVLLLQALGNLHKYEQIFATLLT